MKHSKLEQSKTEETGSSNTSFLWKNITSLKSSIQKAFSPNTSPRERRRLGSGIESCEERVLMFNPAGTDVPDAPQAEVSMLHEQVEDLTERLVEHKNQLRRIGESDEMKDHAAMVDIPEKSLSVAGLMELKNGESYADGHSVEVPGFGEVSLHYGGGWQYGNDMITATSSFYGDREVTVKFSKPTYVHGFSLKHLAGPGVGWVRLTYEDGSTHQVDIGGGGSYAIDASITEIKYDRMHGSSGYGIVDIVVADVVPEPTPEPEPQPELARVTVVSTEPTQQTETQTTKETLAEISDTIELKNAEFNVVSDYLEFSEDDPLHIHATVRYEGERSNPRIQLAYTDATNSRGRMPDSMFVQIGRNGEGYIYQFLGGDHNENIAFTYPELPHDAEVDIDITYDGTKVHVTASHEGEVFTEQSFTPPQQHAKAKIVLVNADWSSSIVRATVLDLEAYKETVVDTPIVSTEEEKQIDQVFADPSLQDALSNLSGSAAAALLDLEGELDAIAEGLQKANEPETVAGHQPAVSEPETPAELSLHDQRIADLLARQEALRPQMDKLVAQRNELLVLRERQETLQAEANVLDANADRVIEKWEEMKDVDTLHIVPEVNIVSERFATEFDVHFRDMPEGYIVEFGSEQHEMNGGSGTITFSDLPRPTINIPYNIDLYDPEGNHVNRIGSQSVISGKITKTAGQNRTEHIPQLAKDIPVPEDMKVSDDAKQEADQHKLECIEIMAATTAEIDSLNAQINAIDAQLLDLKEDYVPYTKMFVEAAYTEGQHPRLIVNVTTPLDQIVVKSGMTKQTRLIQLEPGQTEFTEEFYMNPGEFEKGGTMSIELIDPATQETLARYAADYTPGNHISEKLQANDPQMAWDDWETGRIVENPLSSTLTVVDVIGPNVIVAFQSPFDASYVHLEGEGLFFHEEFEHKGGLELGYAHLVMNTERGSGNYLITVKEPLNGLTIAQQSINWNKETGTVTGPENLPIISISEDNESAKEGLKDMLYHAKALSQIVDTHISTPVLRDALQESMWEDSIYFISYDDSHKYMDNYILKGHPDAGAIFHETLSQWGTSIGNALVAASNYVYAAMSGQNMADAKNEFERAYGSQKDQAGSFGGEFGGGEVSFPSMDAILQEGKRLAKEKFQTLLDRQRQDDIVSGREPGSSEGPVKVKQISDAAYEWNKRVVALVHGENSVQHQSFVAAWRPDDATVVVQNNNSSEQGAEDDGIPEGLARIRVVPNETSLGSEQIAFSEIQLSAYGIAGSNQTIHDVLKQFDQSLQVHSELSEPDFSSLPNCPCTVEELININAENPGFFTKEFWLTRILFHPGAAEGYRHSTPEGPGPQCNYDSNGNLITSGPGAGTTDLRSPDSLGDTVGHFFEDVIPSWSLPAEIYNTLRPIDDGHECPDVSTTKNNESKE